jgi:hypothetical protein
MIIYTYSNNNKGRDVHFPLFCQEWRIRIISFTSMEAEIEFFLSLDVFSAK